MLRLPSSGRGLAWAVPILVEIAALGRSVAFAWIIGPDEMGRAMMLALSLRLVEMASDVGTDRLILQAADGNSARLQSELQGIALVRGLVAGLMVLAFAPVMELLFDDGSSAFSYAMLAAVPAIRGVAHLDFRRAERRFAYLKLTVVEAGATFAMILAIAPALWLTPDHRAMSVVLIANACGFVLLSHIVATRRYRLRLSWPAMLRSWRFGFPLMQNALLLFLTFYADRLIVAKAYDWSALALYGVALQLALLPAQIVGRAAASLVLPMLRETMRRGGFRKVWGRTLATHALLAAAMVLGFTAAGPLVIALFYGEAFRPDPLLTLALAAAAGFRIPRTPFSQLAVAAGRTADPMRANIWRALAVGFAAGFAALGLPLAAIAAAAAIGEGAATLRACQLAKQTSRYPYPKEAFA